MVLCTSNSQLETHKMSSILMFGNAECFLVTSTFLLIVLLCIHDNCLKMFFHQTLQNSEFLILTFLMCLLAISILYRKIATHLLGQEGMSYGGLGFNLFPKNFLLPLCGEWELEITVWVLGLLIAPHFPLFPGLF